MANRQFLARAAVLFATLTLALGLVNAPAHAQLLAASGDRCAGNWNSDPRNPTAIHFTRVGDGTADVVYTFTRSFGGRAEELTLPDRPIDTAGVLTVSTSDVTVNDRTVQRRITMRPGGAGLLAGRVQELRDGNWVTTLEASLVCPARTADTGAAPMDRAPGALDACPDDAQGLRDVTDCLCTAPVPVEVVWGTDIYTDDSNICAAALHAGAIGATGGAVQVTPRAGRESYNGSARNGVTSQDYGAWGNSFTVAAGPPPAPGARATRPATNERR